MNFIFAKLFDEYRRKGDPARLKITMYISLVYFFVSFAILLPIKTVVDKKIFEEKIQYGEYIDVFSVFGLMATITFLVYHNYIRNKYIYKLTDKYKSHRIAKSLLYLIVTLIPVSLLLLAGLVTVLLNGGLFFGYTFPGLME